MEVLFRLCKEHKVMDSISDSLSSGFDLTGEFSIKSFCNCMEDGNAQGGSVFKEVWLNICPPKIELFVWQLLHGRVLVRKEARNQRIFKDIPVDSVWMEDMKWIPPATNLLKFNVDGSVMSSPGFAGICGVLRNHLGKVLCFFSSYVGVQDVISAEILAIARACDLFGSRPDLVRWRLIIACDSKSAVEWVTRRDIEGSNHKQLISHIRNSLHGFGQASVVHCPRASNSYADGLAKKGSAGCEDVLCWSD
ncbi:hypothetical protein Ddye_024716 [Dipteronia dyeriana]|uniref:RNase H type-1 domain-containing protein n=1 Tax=Dipteronia dyeriana TaxID=168575 RepID=A0AAD9TWE3_9ROSI|nr:hypothetical protein Ddye_024716 [Dipteronia dyeriana]